MIKYALAEANPELITAITNWANTFKENWLYTLKEIVIGIAIIFVVAWLYTLLIKLIRKILNNE